MLYDTKGVIRIRISREDMKCLKILKGIHNPYIKGGYEVLGDTKGVFIIRISREDKKCLMILKG